MQGLSDATVEQHTEVGHVFVASSKITLGAGGHNTCSMLLTAGARKTTIFLSSVFADQDGEAYFFLNPSVVGVGTPITPACTNQLRSYAPVSSLVSGTSVMDTSGATLLLNKRVCSSAEVTMHAPLILSPGDRFAVRFSQTVSLPSTVWFNFDWVEA